MSPITTTNGAFPNSTPARLFEKLVLDGFQAGLSWITILRKRENFRRAFDGFEPEKIARFDTRENRPPACRTPASCAIAPRSQAPSPRRGPFSTSRRIEAFPTICGISWTGGRRQRLPRRWARFQRRRRFRSVWRRISRAAASNSAARPSFTPSCRRSAWSMTIWSIVSPSSLPGVFAGLGPVMTAKSAPRAWQRMLSGRRLDILNPSPLDVEIEDIAHGLARVARWNGQTRGGMIFSVAQHSVAGRAKFSAGSIPPRRRAGGCTPCCMTRRNMSSAT